MIRMPELCIAVCIFLLALPGFAQSQADGPGENEAAIVPVEHLLAALADAAGHDDVNERFAALEDIVVQTHDLEYIGELTVRRQWRDWDEEQRREFLEAFEQLSVMSYAARFANVHEQTFTVLGATAVGSGRTQVSVSVQRGDGSSVPLDFVLHQPNAGADAGGWRIANVVADGVSDLALKRAEYRTLLNDAGFDGLVEALGEQITALAEFAEN